jgi:hypothetical protein
MAVVFMRGRMAGMRVLISIALWMSLIGLIMWAAIRDEVTWLGILFAVIYIAVLFPAMRWHYDAIKKSGADAK